MALMARARTRSWWLGLRAFVARTHREFLKRCLARLGVGDAQSLKEVASNFERELRRELVAITEAVDTVEVVLISHAVGVGLGQCGEKVAEDDRPRKEARELEQQHENLLEDGERQLAQRARIVWRQGARARVLLEIDQDAQSPREAGLVTLGRADAVFQA